MSVDEIKKAVESDVALNTWGIGEAINHIDFLLQALAESDKELKATIGVVTAWQNLHEVALQELAAKDKERAESLANQRRSMGEEYDTLAEELKRVRKVAGDELKDYARTVEALTAERDSLKEKVEKWKMADKATEDYASELYKTATKLELERNSLARKLEGIREVYSLLKPMERDMSTNKHHMERVMWEKIKATVGEGE